MGMGGARVRPEDFEDIENKGADTPFCNIGGCALGTQGLFALRTKDPKSDICGCFPRCLCYLLACVANVFLAPFMLVINWFRIYVFPCMFATLHLLLAKFCCDVLGCGACFPKYRDPWFPATDASVGYNLLQGRTKPCCDFFLCCCAKVLCVCHNPCGDTTVPWKRAPDIVPKGRGVGRAKLFDKIEADDVKQGGLGDCWLLSAIASCAEAHPEIIRRLFITQFVEPCGVYRIRLYDVRKEKWVVIVIDDRIPMDDANARPRFTKPNGNELWVMLLEKAFAKMWGSYGYLKGNDGCLALQSFTGNHGVDMFPKQYVAATSLSAFFDVVHGALAHGYLPAVKPPSLLVGAGCRRAKLGLVSGHAYSVLDAASLVSGAKLLQLRNPWGDGEWMGPYSDHDASTARWMETAGMSLLGRKIAKEDGKFWMPVKDFAECFGDCYFVGTNRYVANTTMDFHEEFGACGPCRGCVGGTVDYWCCLQGPRLTCAPERRGTLTMMRDAGLQLDKAGWSVSRYHEAGGFAGGTWNRVGWADNILAPRKDDDDGDEGGSPPAPDEDAVIELAPP